MPVRRVSGGWTFGGAVYKTRAAADRAYAAYRAKKAQKVTSSTKRRRRNKTR